MNKIFGRFMESWILLVSCKVSEGLLQSKRSPYGFTLTLQETWSITDSMNIPKIEFITYIYILIYVKYQFSIFT